MTIQQDPDQQERTRSGSADKAYARRERRAALARGDRLTDTGRPVRAALSRVPFVLAIMLLLAGGIAGVLLLNTLTDAADLETQRSRSVQETLLMDVQEQQQNVARLNSTDEIARAARELGLVPAGDAPFLVIDKNGKGTVIGSPSAVPTPTTTTPAAATTPAVTTGAANGTGTPATGTALTTAPAGTAPATTGAATAATTAAGR
ncbi:hypothetical protein GIS00_21505 [Nakamurella sp. YIM 132087]|uniref:Cell division protein FtsL n=1 Tax=Nakamurella alba TaxID=2665158 RepID=A0A7K1FQU7_9ACTN|nr:hypothetical protein [Nakamurella alba]MTD16517.1 hypothetical protein [Nakamurella alba]